MSATASNWPAKWWWTSRTRWTSPPLTPWWCRAPAPPHPNWLQLCPPREWSRPYNTFAAALRSKSIGPNPTVVLVAGEDADAKDILIEAVQAGDVEAVEVGPLRRSRVLEAVGFLQLTLAASAKSAAGGFALLR